MYAKSCSCCSEISLRCGDDYLEVDDRALAFQGDNWPDNLVKVKLIFESAAGCGCVKNCSVTVEGTYFAAGAKAGFEAGDNYTSAAGTVTPYNYPTAWFDVKAAVASRAANLNGWRLIGITSNGSVVTLDEGPLL